MSRRPKHEVWITTQNHWDYCRPALESVLRHTPEHVRIVVVDDGSDSEARVKLARFSSRTNIPVLWHREPKGLTAGWREAVDFSDPRGHVTILNNDILVASWWHDRMLRGLQQHPDVGMVGVLSNNPGHRSGQNVRLHAPGFSKDEVRDPAQLERINATLEPGFVYAEHGVNGFAFLLRRECIKEVGNFDPKNRSLGNEDEYQERMRAAGWKSGFVTDVHIWHAKRVTLPGRA